MSVSLSCLGQKTVHVHTIDDPPPPPSPTPGVAALKVGYFFLFWQVTAPPPPPEKWNPWSPGGATNPWEPSGDERRTDSGGLPGAWTTVAFFKNEKTKQEIGITRSSYSFVVLGIRDGIVVFLEEQF